jgi:hypothetical protein
LSESAAALFAFRLCRPWWILLAWIAVNQSLRNPLNQRIGLLGRIGYLFPDPSIFTHGDHLLSDEFGGAPSQRYRRMKPSSDAIPLRRQHNAPFRHCLVSGHEQLTNFWFCWQLRTIAKVARSARHGPFFAALISIAWSFSHGEARAADVLVKSYLSESRPAFREYNKLFLDGVMSGFRWYTLWLQAEGKSMLFCVPPTLDLKFEQGEDIMLGWAKRHPELSNSSYVSGALLAGLEETFPCKK